MIRQAINTDAEQISRSYEELLRYEKENVSFTNWREGVYPTIQVPLNTIPKGTMYVLEDQGKICASMVLNKEQAPEYQQIDWHYLAKAEEVLVIHTLCISPKHAGKGYGSQMVRFAMQYAQELGCKVIRLDTYVGNKPAASFYQKLGFRFAGVAPALLQGLISEDLMFLEYNVGDQ